jgi:hypothetical protein
MRFLTRTPPGGNAGIGASAICQLAELGSPTGLDASRTRRLSVAVIVINRPLKKSFF